MPRDLESQVIPKALTNQPSCPWEAKGVTVSATASKASQVTRYMSGHQGKSGSCFTGSLPS